MEFGGFASQPLNYCLNINVNIIDVTKNVIDSNNVIHQVAMKIKEMLPTSGIHFQAPTLKKKTNALSFSEKNLKTRRFLMLINNTHTYN